MLSTRLVLSPYTYIGTSCVITAEPVKLSTDLTEFIRSVPIVLSLTDRNETERTERTKPNLDFEMDNRTTETSERTCIYSGKVG